MLGDCYCHCGQLHFAIGHFCDPEQSTMLGNSYCHCGQLHFVIGPFCDSEAKAPAGVLSRCFVNWILNHCTYVSDG